VACAGFAEHPEHRGQNIAAWRLMSAARLSLALSAPLTFAFIVDLCVGKLGSSTMEIPGNV
jgi:hypothetical protein